ncbi:VIT1/CCC1 transporter family protein [Lactococcus fujiensis]|uniref:Integral membrane protein n=1 Tax=Lactococcus fujiensis JCM 16395 TaxID=1291764 RepID=A0A2A5RJK4_9LACT|nr:VIT family protein [Lactococcus fujiensis]PCR99299.1 hypothetical protein RT41_GL001940 [Lactococcus fujiensis JCM 16395]
MSKKSKMTMDEKLNSVRAGVLGSNDGILTVVGVLFSVSAVSGSSFALLISSLANLVSGAFSMASGEYASVSSQSDSEKAIVEQERDLLLTDFEGQRQFVVNFYQEKGISVETSEEIADELLNKKPLETVLATKYDISLGHYASPFQAAWSSFFSFGIAGLFPMVTMLFVKGNLQFPVTILATVVALSLTGYISAKLSDGFVKKAVLRNIIIGLITIAIHYGIGKLFG